jgi:hypothetical protein
MSADHFHDAVFTWPSTDPSEVILTGSFDQWSRSIRLEKGPSGFSATVKLPWDQSRVEYKYLVDGRWETRWDQPFDHSSYSNTVYTLPPRPSPSPAEAEAASEPSHEEAKVEADEKVATEAPTHIHDVLDQNSQGEKADEEIEELSATLSRDKATSLPAEPELATIAEVAIEAVPEPEGVERAPETASSHVAPEPKEDDFPEFMSNVAEIIIARDGTPTTLTYSTAGLGAEIHSVNVEKSAFEPSPKENAKAEHSINGGTFVESPRSNSDFTAESRPTFTAEPSVSESDPAPATNSSATQGSHLAEPSESDSVPTIDTASAFTSEPESLQDSTIELFTKPNVVPSLPLDDSNTTTQPESELAPAGTASSKVSTHIPLGGATNETNDQDKEGKTTTHDDAHTAQPESDGETLTPEPESASPQTNTNATEATTTLPSPTDTATKPEPEPKSSAPPPPTLSAVSAPATPTKNAAQNFPSASDSPSKRSMSSSTVTSSPGEPGSTALRKKRPSLFGKLKHVFGIDDEKSKEEKREKKRRSTLGKDVSP